MREAHRGRMNGADWFLLILVILSVGGFLLRFWDMRRGRAADLQLISVTARWADVDQRTAACLREGEVLYTAAGEVFGTVRSLTVRPTEVETVAVGKTYRLESQTRVDVTVDIRVQCRVSEGQFLRGGSEALSVGQQQRLYSPMAELTVKLLSFQ